MNHSTTSSGVTLVELLIAITIISIATTFALSNWSRWINDVRHRAQINAYAELFNYGRWMAASQNRLVTLCPLNEANHCEDDWNRPVSVFPDSDNNKQPDNGTVWRILEAPAEPFTVRSRTGGRGYLQFSASGMVHGASGGLVLCPKTDSSGGKMSYLAINRGGRFRAEHDLDGDRHLRLSWGTDIYCAP
ncbi:GspH/FimT family pseudopilin [Marinobacter zhejiangensis]|uniref:Type II secretion system protein H n=1 Tax=Marinobacter zhejiangensis TaxID=488535 RepID=A0A1I4S793_9GAMM|nr:GspH/FimT family pseudopilin [Marinobacter zhejiangensis]SFM60367.1 type IV fimbrial biogenesis protein FimT [Marinobacter zhejiangensis]